MNRGGFDRLALRQALGEPSDQIGSVNEPRLRTSGGIEWNEKWVYRVKGGPRNGRTSQIVLWHRYDFVGIFRVGDDGSLAEEVLELGDGDSGGRRQ